MHNKSLKITVTVFAAVIIAAAAFLAGFFTRKATQGEELSRLEWALETIDKNYFFGVEGDMTGSALSAISDKYLDIYSDYYTKEEYEALNATTSGSRKGIGIGYAYVEGRGVYISSVVLNSPAYICGLREGEYLLRGRLSSGKEVAFTSAEAFSGLIDSAADGEDITLKSANDSYTVSKQAYTSSYTLLSLKTTGYGYRTSGDKLVLTVDANLAMPSLPADFGYIKLNQFYGTAAQEMQYLLQQFNASHCTSLILDLRSNGGGFVSTMCDIAGSFTSDGNSRLAMVAKYKNGREDRFMSAEVKDATMRIPENCKVYVLADAGTASASEALIGALVCYGCLDYENVFIADYGDEYLNYLKSRGQKEPKTGRTYGKGIMQTTFENHSTGEALKLTTATIYWPDTTTCIHDRGLTAGDGCTLFKAEWEHTLPDAALQNVIQTIKTRA